MSEQNLVLAAETVVRKCLNVKPNEVFLIITDTERLNIANAIFKAGLDVGAEVIMTIMKPRTRHGEEPPKPIAEMWKLINVFVAPTTYSLTHTQARKNAVKAGARGATMPGITEDMFVRTLGIDYSIVKEYVEKMYNAMKGCKEARVISPLGTDITLSIEERPLHKDTGIYHNPGDFGNLPAGEIYVAPIEGTANGKIVFDGAVASIGLLSNPIEITVKEGYAAEITGGKEAEKLKSILESVQKKEAYNIAELGIGCNPAAKIVGKVLEDEKVFGTVHIALGDNSTFGGKTIAGIHLDGIIKNPTLIVDEKTIIEDGKWLI